MIDWNALAEQHKRGSTELERTVTLLCREMAKLVPQEVAEPGEMRLIDARANPDAPLPNPAWGGPVPAREGED